MEKDSTVTIVVIPAYEPDEKLIELISLIKSSTNYNIIVVNDGSSKNKDYIFDAIKNNVLLINHTHNKGKGAALKTALNYIYSTVLLTPATVVLADADGQHNTNDIIKVVNNVTSNNQLVLGSRNFNEDIPLKSKLGNIITRNVFHIASGKKLADTQTGLRGFTINMVPLLLKIPGDRYEYETNMLIKCTKNSIEIKEIEIETIYIDDNSSSHFNPIRDSISIYKDIIKFSCSSFVSFILDYFLYALLVTLIGSISYGIIISNVFAGLISAIFNYELNRQYVFPQKAANIKSAVQYFCLAVFIMFMNTLLLSIFINTNIFNKYSAKIIVEFILFIISLTIQKFIIFKKLNTNAPNPITKTI